MILVDRKGKQEKLLQRWGMILVIRYIRLYILKSFLDNLFSHEQFLRKLSKFRESCILLQSSVFILVARLMDRGDPLFTENVALIQNLHSYRLSITPMTK